MHEDAPAQVERSRSYRGDPGFLARECVTRPGSEVVRAGDAIGTRWRHWILRFERHTGDDMPAVDRTGPFRLVVWQPTRPTARPSGWVRGTRGMSVGLTGHVALRDDYRAGWPAHARRHVAKWERQAEWTVETCELGPFLEAYRRSTQDAFLRVLFATVLKEKIAGHGERVRLTVARRRGEILAGFASVDVPETGESFHLMSFIRPEAREASAGIGLMDRWFRDARERGLRYLDFGIFWRRGDPSSWKGFSRFKSQFVNRFVDYPPPFLRFAGRWGAKE